MQGIPHRIYSFSLFKELNGLGLDHEAFREGMNIAGMTLIDRSHPVYLEKEYQQLAKLHRDLFPKNHPIQVRVSIAFSQRYNISLHTDIKTYRQSCAHKYIHTGIQTYIHAYVYVYSNIHAYLYLSICLSVCLPTCMHACM